MIVIILIAIFIILNIADILLTNKILKAGGTELNPMMAWAMKMFKDKWWIGKLILCLIVIGGTWFLYERQSTNAALGLALGVNILYAWIVWSNFTVFKKMSG